MDDAAPREAILSAQRELLVNGIGDNASAQQKRGCAWKMILGSVVDSTEYVSLVQMGPSRLSKRIELDVVRALAGDKEASLLRNARVRLLNAFVHWVDSCSRQRSDQRASLPDFMAKHESARSAPPQNPYAQGMGGAAAVLLHVLPEPDAFCAFRGLVTSFCPILYAGDGVREGCRIADQILAAADPDLHAALRTVYGATPAYADLLFYSRICSLYATRGPLQAVSRLWDVVLGVGIQVVPCICVAELLLRREEILRAGRDAITRFQSITSAESTKDQSYLTKLTSKPEQGGGGESLWTWHRLVPASAVEALIVLALEIASSLPEQVTALLDEYGQAMAGTASYRHEEEHGANVVPAAQVSAASGTAPAVAGAVGSSWLSSASPTADSCAGTGPRSPLVPGGTGTGTGTGPVVTGTGGSGWSRPGTTRAGVRGAGSGDRGRAHQQNVAEGCAHVPSPPADLSVGLALAPAPVRVVHHAPQRSVSEDGAMTRYSGNGMRNPAMLQRDPSTSTSWHGHTTYIHPAAPLPVTLTTTTAVRGAQQLAILPEEGGEDRSAPVLPPYSPSRSHRRVASQYNSLSRPVHDLGRGERVAGATRHGKYDSDTSNQSTARTYGTEPQNKQ